MARSISKLASVALLPLIAAGLFVVSGATQQPAAQSTDGRLQLKGKPASVTVAQPGQIPVLIATVVKAYPHDPHGFTQGLEFFDGYLYESTGRQSQSTLRRVVIETGKVVQSVRLPDESFGEGLTIFHGKIYQLTWLDKTGFIYDLRTFRKLGKFSYNTEGWGLTHDDASLILSDGTNRLQYIDPNSFEVTKTLEVFAGPSAVTNLNELEFIRGEIWANIWHSDRIARIDPKSGRVTAWIDLTAIAERETHEQEDVLNGIAWDPGRQRLFVTGKDWSKLYEIVVK
ncbi:MAG TPA: glutaminyl-peptide cyclotransferase [Candidatus Eremiobacteraceae bacterium]|nr:glutaminyl-peptide cyclotransferase [Candidatus Eremiobacteraceae bacterium]